MDRDSITQNLLSASKREDMRALVCPEIIAAFTQGDSFPEVLKNSEGYQGLSAQRRDPDQAASFAFSRALTQYCLRQEVYEAFIENALRGSNWLTFMRDEKNESGQPKRVTGILDAIALLTHKKVYVWQRESPSSCQLELIHDSPNEGSDIHMLHTDQGTHFNLLSEKKWPEQPRQERPMSSSSVAVISSARSCLSNATESVPKRMKRSPLPNSGLGQDNPFVAPIQISLNLAKKRRNKTPPSKCLK